MGTNRNIKYKWQAWERWCEQILKILYPKTYVSQPYTKLSNNKMPDFHYIDKYGFINIVDAKKNALNDSVFDSIKNYLPYCNYLEFWCLFNANKKKTTRHGRKMIFFYGPSNLLNRIPEKHPRKEILKIKLKEIYQLKNLENNRSKLAGKRFGLLTIIEKVEDSKKSLWKAICDCGKETEIETLSLKRGTQSCGCLRGKHKLFGIKGQRFGKLIAINLSYKRGSYFFECLCDCGKKIFASSTSLRNGDKKSCARKCLSIQN